MEKIKGKEPNLVNLTIITAEYPFEPTCYINRQGRWDKMELSAQREPTCYVNRKGATQGQIGTQL